MSCPPVSAAMSCKHGLAPIAEARRLDRRALQYAADLIDDQRREGLALDIFGDEEDRLAGLGHLLQQREHVLEDIELAVADEHVRILEDRLHAVGVGDEVRGEISAIELHALDDLERGLGRLGFLDRDDAVAADLFHGIGDQLADGGIVMRGDGRDLCLLLAAADRLCQCLHRLHRRRQDHGPVRA